MLPELVTSAVQAVQALPAASTRVCVASAADRLRSTATTVAPGGA